MRKQPEDRTKPPEGYNVYATDRPGEYPGYQCQIAPMDDWHPDYAGAAAACWEHRDAMRARLRNG